MVLFADGLGDDAVNWAVIGSGAAVRSILVLALLRGSAVDRAVAGRPAGRAGPVDALTGAPNRRTWDYELSRACASSLETGTPLSVAMMDMDHFKAYNDTHGHQAGDRLLREAVAAWTEQLGPPGLLARYGGEEFAVLLPGYRIAGAEKVISVI